MLSLAYNLELCDNIYMIYDDMVLNVLLVIGIGDWFVLSDLHL